MWSLPFKGFLVSVQCPWVRPHCRGYRILLPSPAPLSPVALMPTTFGLLELSEQKPRGGSPADVGLPQRPQVFDGACEISRSNSHPRGCSPELEGRHGKQMILDLLFWRVCILSNEMK